MQPRGGSFPTIMSDRIPATEKDLEATPKRTAAPKKQPDTPFLCVSSEGPIAGFATPKECRDALQTEFETCTTTMSEKTSLSYFATLFTKHNLNTPYFTEQLLKYLQDVGQYSKDDIKRWIHIPVKPARENELYVPFRDTIQIIIAKLRKDNILKGTREARVTANTVQKHTSDGQNPAAGDDKRAHKTKPDLLIIGNDSKFLGKDFKNKSSELYKNAIVVVEMKKEESADTEVEIRAQLGMYARYEPFLLSLQACPNPMSANASCSKATGTSSTALLSQRNTSNLLSLTTVE